MKFEYEDMEVINKEKYDKIIANATYEFSLDRRTISDQWHLSVNISKGILWTGIWNQIKYSLVPKGEYLTKAEYGLEVYKDNNDENLRYVFVLEYEDEQDPEEEPSEDPAEYRYKEIGVNKS